MSSSQAYLGAFESKDEIVIRINKEYLETVWQQYNEDDEIVLTEKQWRKIYKAIYEADIVADAIENASQLAIDILEDGNL